MEFENVEDAQTYLEKTTSLITDYYEKQLNTSKYEFYYIVEIPIIKEKAPNLYIASIHIGCGLLQNDDEFFAEDEAIVDYTN